jgi:hypothetical protein
MSMCLVGVGVGISVVRGHRIAFVLRGDDERGVAFDVFGRQVR